MDVSIIIVSYNTAKLTIAAIDSIYKETKKVSFEIILVDNASSDGSAGFIIEQFPEVKLISLDYNAGFASANNLAAKQAKGRYVLLLNPDTLVLDSAVDKLVSWADEHPEWGVYGGSTFFADSIRNPTAGWMEPTILSMFFYAIGLTKLFPRSRFFNRESLKYWNWEHPKQVDIITGCLMMLKNSDWDYLGGFDTQFFMYGEDSDLCLRAAKLGLKSVLIPQVCIIHYGGASEPVHSDKMVRLFRSKVLLFKTHYSSIKEIMMTAMLRLRCLVGIFIFVPASLFKPRFKKYALQWIEIWKRRHDWLN
jgi:GT2 family glycosyltransferase